MYESHRHFVEQKKPDTAECIMCFHLSEVQEQAKLIIKNQSQKAVASGKGFEGIF